MMMMMISKLLELISQNKRKVGTKYALNIKLVMIQRMAIIFSKRSEADPNAPTEAPDSTQSSLQAGLQVKTLVKKGKKK